MTSRHRAYSGGLPIEVFNQLRSSHQADRSNSGRTSAWRCTATTDRARKVSQGMRESFRLHDMPVQGTKGSGSVGVRRETCAHSQYSSSAKIRRSTSCPSPPPTARSSSACVMRESIRSTCPSWSTPQYVFSRQSLPHAELCKRRSAQTCAHRGKRQRGPHPGKTYACPSCTRPRPMLSPELTRQLSLPKSASCFYSGWSCLHTHYVIGQDQDNRRIRSR